MVTNIAILVEAPSIKAMQSGLRSLHSKSIRRMRAFRAVPDVTLRINRVPLFLILFASLNDRKTMWTYFEGPARYQER